MALSPSEISRMLAIASRMATRGECAEAFVLAWTGWEAYNHRAMAVGLQFQGISQKDADWVLKARDSGNLKRARKLRAQVFAQGPEGVSSVAAMWRRLEQTESGRTYRERRNDLVHGTGSADPAVLREGVDLIVGAVLSDCLLSVLEVPVRFGDGAGEVVRLGDVLSRSAGSRGSRRGTADRLEVLEWLGGPVRG